MTTTVTIGIDEVGRGCLLGPLVVVAVTNPMNWHNDEVRDSKQIKSERKRNRIAAEIVNNVMWSLASVEPHVINEVGISQALESAYIKVLDDLIPRQLKVAPDSKLEIILDGMMMSGIYKRYNLAGKIEVTALVGADAKVFESSCASLIAKATRDKWCHDIVKVHPEMAIYHVETNKGYDSPNHTNALISHGMTDQHRIQFCHTRLVNEGLKRNMVLPLKGANGAVITMSNGSRININPSSGKIQGSMTPEFTRP